MDKLTLITLCIVISQCAFAQDIKLKIEGSIVISDSESANPLAGTIRWTGDDFEGFDGTSWKSLTCGCDDDNPETNPQNEALFSDVLAAPIGAPITIYGTDLSGPIVIGGVAMTNCPIIDQTVFSDNTAGVRLAKTTCYVENVPLGVTTISTSTGTLPFSVINGTVQTITTPAQLSAAMQNPVPGDFFILQGFTYDLTAHDTTNYGKQIIWMRTNEHDASPLNPIALIGDPLNPAKFVVDGVDNGDRAITLENTGWTVANLDFDTFWQALSAKGEHRFVGNRITGMTGPRYASGTGTISATGMGRGDLIAGNVITGGDTDWRLDHTIYLSGCTEEKGWTVEWNYMYDNNFSRGPQISINHQPPRCGTGAANVSVASHTIRNNVIDMTNHSGRAISLYSQGWESDNNPTPPEPVIIEGNWFINAGYTGDDVDIFGEQRKGPAIADYLGNSVIKDNIFFNPNNSQSSSIYIGSLFINDPNDWINSTVTGNVINGSNPGFDIIDQTPAGGSSTVANNTINP